MSAGLVVLSGVNDAELGNPYDIRLISHQLYLPCYAAVDDLHSHDNPDTLESEAGVPTNRPPAANVGLSAVNCCHLCLSRADAYALDFPKQAPSS